MENNIPKLTEILDSQFNLKISGNTEQFETNILMELPANDWIELAKTLPNPKELFGTIWHQGEVAILFSNTGKGKSILGVQLANAIAKGENILEQKSFKQISIYFDFELSSKAFQMRYTDNFDASYTFSQDFYRVEIDRDKELETEEKSFEELIIDSIKFQVEKSKAQVVIIDNITFLSASNEKSKEALALMKLILNLSRKKNLAILLIAHTPKRDIYKPIQLEDLAGSKALSNFCDVVFCIGESVKGSKIRYIKQLKNRNFPLEFHENNVIECEIVKENSFLQFKYLGTSTEDSHLRKIESNNDSIEDILELKKQEFSNVEIGKRLGISESAVRRRLKKYQNTDEK